VTDLHAIVHESALDLARRLSRETDERWSANEASDELASIDRHA
jgi:hypothetical protein